MSHPGGRPPTPTLLKLLRGNPGHRTINKQEPEIAVQVPQCPSELSPRAKKEWRRISKILIQAKILTPADRAALSSYCQYWAIWIEAVAKVNTQGAVVTKPGSVDPIVNPFLVVARTAHDQMKAMMGELGLSASSRSRIIAGGKGTNSNNPWAEDNKR